MHHIRVIQTSAHHRFEVQGSTMTIVQNYLGSEIVKLPLTES